MLCSPVPSTASALACQTPRKCWEVSTLFVCVHKVAGNFQGISRFVDNVQSADSNTSLNFLPTACQRHAPAW